MYIVSDSIYRHICKIFDDMEEKIFLQITPKKQKNICNADKLSP